MSSLKEPCTRFTEHLNEFISQLTGTNYQVRNAEVRQQSKRTWHVVLDPPINPQRQYLVVVDEILRCTQLYGDYDDVMHYGFKMVVQTFSHLFYACRTNGEVSVWAPRLMRIRRKYLCVERFIIDLAMVN